MPQPLQQSSRKHPARTFQGEVVKKSGAKTVAVKVANIIRHPLYGKSIKKSKSFLVHDPKEEAHVGDTVVIVECRPISKRKHWRIVKTTGDSRPSKTTQEGTKIV